MCRRRALYLPLLCLCVRGNTNRDVNIFLLYFFLSAEPSDAGRLDSLNIFGSGSGPRRSYFWKKHSGECWMAARHSRVYPECLNLAGLGVLIFLEWGWGVL